MAQPFDYVGLMGGAANLGGVSDTVQRAVLGQQQQQLAGQQVQANQAVLDQQARADQVRQAASILADPNADAIARQAAEDQIRIAAPDQYRALIQQRQQKADVAAYTANPTAAGMLRLATTYPGLKDQLEKPWAAYSDAARDAKVAALADFTGYLKAGDSEGALRVLRRHQEADRAAGLPVDGYSQLTELVGRDPKAALGVGYQMLSGAMGADKFADSLKTIGGEQREEELHPLAVRKAGAEASQEETAAQFAPKVAQSNLDTAAAQRQRLRDQTAIDRAGLAIQRDRLNEEIAARREKVANAAVDLDVASRKFVNDAVVASVVAGASANRLNSLADRMAGANIARGWSATLREQGKGAFGNQDAVTGLRAEYTQLRNSEAVKNLPRGPASDRDVAFAMEGFPPSNASPQYIASFLRGMAKIQQAAAETEDRKAAWISANGSLGTARRGIAVGGVPIPAGTSFTEFNNEASSSATGLRTLTPEQAAKLPKGARFIGQDGRERVRQ